MTTLTTGGGSSAVPFIIRIAEKVNTSLERHFWRWVVLFMVPFLACLIVIDIGAKMWTDELFTLYIAQQASPAEIVKSIKEGCDGAPPLYPIIVHWILPLFKNDALAIRLPSTIGFSVMIICLLAFCRRRLPAAYSIIATLFACDACLYYSTEGRGYGVILGCTAAALLCWQTAAECHRRSVAIPLLALCLALMISMHYYALFFLGPLFLAEMVRAWTSRKLDFGILAAMIPAVVVLGLHYPLFKAGAQYQAHFWSKGGIGMVEPFYTYFSHRMLYFGALAMVVVAVFPKSPGPVQEAHIPIHESMFIGALAALPIFVITASKYATHMFVDRYLCWAAIGLALVACALIFRAVRGRIDVALTLLSVLLALAVLREVVNLRRMPYLRDGEAMLQRLKTLPNDPETIVVPDAHTFVELSYYAEPRIRERLVYPASPALDLHYFGWDTDPLLLIPTSRRTKLRVREYDALLAEYPRFLLAAEPKEYLPWHLVAAGYRVVPISSGDVKKVVFQVESNAAPAQ
jgi:hypothetical protein